MSTETCDEASQLRSETTQSVLPSHVQMIAAEDWRKIVVMFVPIVNSIAENCRSPQSKSIPVLTYPLGSPNVELKVAGALFDVVSTHEGMPG